MECVECILINLFLSYIKRYFEIQLLNLTKKKKQICFLGMTINDGGLQVTLHLFHSCSARAFDDQDLGLKVVPLLFIKH